MCFGCFFFKQKTAYEMRISDWSSDVCSSDLLTAANLCNRAPCRDAESGMDQFMREDGRDLCRHGVGRMGKVRTDEDFKMAVRAQPVIPALEIGRASCRERVCQYV